MRSGQTGRLKDLEQSRARLLEILDSSAWFPLCDASVATHGVCGPPTDVTGQKRAEGEIRKLNADLARRAVELIATTKELERLSYSVSHGLSQPLRDEVAAVERGPGR